MKPRRQLRTKVFCNDGFSLSFLCRYVTSSANCPCGRERVDDELIRLERGGGAAIIVCGPEPATDITSTSRGHGCSSFRFRSRTTRSKRLEDGYHESTGRALAPIVR